MDRRAAAGLALVIALAGCANSGVPSGGPPSGAPAGTRLADWLVSPPGTVLLGAPFPRSDGGFDALLLVPRAPLAAVADVLAQAARAGFGVPTYPGVEATPPCSARDGGDWRGGEPRPVDRPGRPRWLTCSVFAAAPTDDGLRRSMTLELIVGPDDDPYLSHLLLSEWTAPGESASAGGTVQVLPPGGSPSTPGPVEELPLPTPSLEPLPTVPTGAAEPDPPPYPDTLPGPGDRLARRYTPDGERYEVLPGSALVAPEFPATGGTGGFHAVLRLDGATLDDYDELARHEAFNGLPRERASPDETFPIPGGTATYRDYSGAGAGNLTLRTVSVTGGATYLMISRQAD